MRAENFSKQPLELAGWNVHLTSYRIGGHFLAEVEALDSGVTIARATAERRDEAEEEAVQAAVKRLNRTHRVDLDLTVGG
jgi:hypothetical protein